MLYIFGYFLENLSASSLVIKLTLPSLSPRFDSRLVHYVFESSNFWSSQTLSNPRSRDMTYAQPLHAFPEAPIRTTWLKNLPTNDSWKLLWEVWGESVLPHLFLYIIYLPSATLTWSILQQPIVIHDPLFCMLWLGCCVVFMIHKIWFKHTPTKKMALTSRFKPLGNLFYSSKYDATSKGTGEIYELDYVILL